MCRGCTQRSGSQSFCAAYSSLQSGLATCQHTTHCSDRDITRTGPPTSCRHYGPRRLPWGGATEASAPPPPPPLPLPPRPSAGSASTVLRRCGGAAMQGGGGADTRQLHSRCGAAAAAWPTRPGGCVTRPPPVLHDAVRLIRGGSGQSASPSRPLDSAHAHPCRPAARRARGRCAARWSCGGASWRRGSRPPP